MQSASRSPASIPEIDLAARSLPKSSTPQKEELAKSSCSFPPTKELDQNYSSLAACVLTKPALRYISPAFQPRPEPGFLFSDDLFRPPVETPDVLEFVAPENASTG